MIEHDIEPMLFGVTSVRESSLLTYDIARSYEGNYKSWHKQEAFAGNLISIIKNNRNGW